MPIRMWKIPLLLLLAAPLASSARADDPSTVGTIDYAWIDICNNSGIAFVDAAVAQYDTDSGGWQSSAWYTVKNGKCRRIQLGGYRGYFYVHGRAAGVHFSNDDAFLCVDGKDAFTFSYADEIPCNGGTAEKAGFSQTQIVDGGNTFNFNP